MIDANTHALNEYERKQDKADMIDAMWMKATEHLYKQLEEIAKEYRNIAMHFKDEYGHEADWREDADNALGV